MILKSKTSSVHVYNIFSFENILTKYIKKCKYINSFFLAPLWCTICPILLPQKSLTLFLDQGMNSSVTSHNVCRTDGQLAGIPYRSTFTQAMGQPPPYYQSVTPIAQPYLPGTHSQAPPLYQPGNQCKFPTSLAPTSTTYQFPFLEDTRHFDRRIAGRFFRPVNCIIIILSLFYLS